MMCSNNCVEVLGKSVGWEVRGQLYKHYIITVPNSNLLKLEMGLAKYATSVFSGGAPDILAFGCWLF